MDNKKAIQAGICIKDGTQKVVEQDDTCRDICGDQKGQICTKGCMQVFGEIKQEPLFRLGFNHLKNIEIDNRKVDAIIFYDGETITTHVHSLEELNEKKIAMMQEKGLSKSEINVMKLVLQGLSNQQIAEKLFISKATLKTHLNNIYKKLPESYRPSRG